MENTQEYKNNIQINHAQDMPGISDLFSETINTFKGSLKKVILVFLKYLLVSLIPVTIFTIITLSLVAYFTNGIGSGSVSYSQLFILIPIVILIAVFAMLFYNAYFASTLIAVSKYKENLPTKELFKQGFKYAFPMFTASLLNLMFSSFSFIVFIIPGVLVSIFFSFYYFEIIFNGKRGIESLKSSYRIIKNNFWQILLRLIIITVVVQIPSFIFKSLDKSLLQNQLSVIYILFIVIYPLLTYLIGLFQLNYLYVLYQHARSVTSEDSKVNITWIWVFMIIGIIMSAGGIYLLNKASLSTSELKNNINFYQESSITEPLSL